jgi:hypothetical protein
MRSWDACKTQLAGQEARRRARTLDAESEPRTLIINNYVDGPPMRTRDALPTPSGVEDPSQSAQRAWEELKRRQAEGDDEEADDPNMASGEASPYERGTAEDRAYRQGYNQALRRQRTRGDEEEEQAELEMQPGHGPTSTADWNRINRIKHGRPTRDFARKQVHTLRSLNQFMRGWYGKR